MAGAQGGVLMRLIIIGAGGHGRVVLELARATGRYDVVGFVDPEPQTKLIMGVPVLGGDEILPQLRTEGLQHAFVALGSNRVRERVGVQLRSLGFERPSLVHPSAFVSPTARLEEGSLVMARAVLGTQAVLEDGAILNTGAVADHDNRLSANCHVAPGCALAGFVSIGARTLVGAGTSIRPEIRVGSDAVVGAGAAVVSDVPDGVTVVGVPARVLKRA
jgi:sugar O-acyltransferase (sialic acid O-acetyltransferase NeuD family)